MTLLPSLAPLLFAVAFPVIVWQAPILRARLFGPCTQERHDAALEVWKMMATLTTVFLVFLLVQSMGYYRDAEVAAAKEAANLMQLDRALANSGQGQDSPVRTRLRDYARGVIEDEWPAMLAGVDSEAMNQTVRTLQQSIGELVANQPERAARQDVLRYLNDVEDDRAARLGAANNSVPSALWVIGGSLLALLLFTVAHLSPERMVTKMVIVHAAGLAMLAALLFVMDGPLKGAVSVAPRAMQKSSALLSRG
jgi:hypothetical protein